MKLTIATPVWGANHVGLFLEIGLPSLLAPGNLPKLAAEADCTYLVYLRSDEIGLTEHEVFARLRATLPVEIRTIPEPMGLPHRVMSDCHVDALQHSDENEAATVFIPPDCVWSDGSMEQMLRIARSGASMIHISGIRLDRDKAVPKLREHLNTQGSELTIGARPLVEIGLSSLHPIAFTHYWKEHEGGLMPANLYWTVPDEGLAVRCFHLHPLLINPQVRGAKFTSTIDDDLALKAAPEASRDYVVTDSDELLTFELSGLDRVVGADFHKGSIESVACWAEVGTNARHHLLARNPIRIHHATPTEELWRPIEAEGDHVVTEAVRIAHLGWPEIAAKYPAVLSWRAYAVSMSLGRYSSGGSAMLRLTLRAFRRLVHGNLIVYRMLFDRYGNPRPLHPRRWFLRATPPSSATGSPSRPLGMHNLIVAAGLQRRGQLKQRLRLLRSAIRDYSEAIEVSAPNPALHFLRGTARLQRGDTIGAAEDFEAGLALDPNNVTLDHLLKQARFGSAGNQGAAVMRDWVEAQRMQRRGRLKHKFRLLRPAIRDYSRAIEYNASNPALYFLRGTARLKRGDTAGAAEDFEAGLALDPSNMALQHLLKQTHSVDVGAKAAQAMQDWVLAERLQRRGRINHKFRLLGPAIHHYSRAIEKSASNPALYFLRGTARLQRGDTAAAAKDFEAGLALDPSNATLQHLLDLARSGVSNSEGVQGSQKWAQAEKMLRRGHVKYRMYLVEQTVLETVESTIYEIFFDRSGNARVLHPRKWFGGATKPVDDAMPGRMNGPMLQKARHGKAQTVSSSKPRFWLLESAVRDYGAALEVSAPNPALYFLRGTARLEQGDRAGAAQDFEAGLALEPTNTTLRALLGQARSDDAGAQSMRQARRMLRRGRIKHRLRLLGPAIHDYSQAIDANVADPSLYFLRGTARLKRGDTVGAAEDFEAGLILDPSNATLHRLLQQTRRGKSEPLGGQALK